MEELTNLKLTHDVLVQKAYAWVLKRGGCGAAFMEMYTAASEFPDVIGFGSWGHSVLVECKASRSDFLNDKKKGFRKNPEKGMGSHRYYCCPTGMIKPEELPPHWGLLYVSAKGKIHLAYNPSGGNVVRSTSAQEKNWRAEHSFMYSMLRRFFVKGLAHHLYDKQYESPTANEVIDRNKV